MDLFVWTGVELQLVTSDPLCWKQIRVNILMNAIVTLQSLFFTSNGLYLLLKIEYSIAVIFTINIFLGITIMPLSFLVTMQLQITS